MPYKAHDDKDIGDIDTGTRVCRKCGERKPMRSFSKSVGSKKQAYYRRRTCLWCAGERRRQLKKADPEKYSLRGRERHLLAKYGLTLANFAAMMTEQGGKCAICENSLTSPHIDHDHDTGEVRGLLCFKCNTALGKFGDNPELLLKAWNYLTRRNNDNNAGDSVSTD